MFNAWLLAFFVEITAISVTERVDTEIPCTGTGKLRKCDRYVLPVCVDHNVDQVISAFALIIACKAYSEGVGISWNGHIPCVNVMSVDIPVFEYKTRTPDANDIYSYGFAFTSSDLDGAVKSLADILPDMLRLAEVEKACQLMASEIEKTRRRVNALEHVIIPEARANIKYITMKLDENERSTQIRLMKVKDMMLEEAHHYKEREAERGA